MQFETAVFLDKELIALLSGDADKGEPDEDHYEITDALILIQIHLDGKPEWILSRSKTTEKQAFCSQIRLQAAWPAAMISGAEGGSVSAPREPPEGGTTNFFDLLILIHWEQQGKKEKNFERRMFHYFCGIYFRHEKLVFPIAMFTDSARWRKPVKNEFSLSLGRHPICEFTYHLIKLKDLKAEAFEKKIGENPLTAAYLPLTDYPKKDRPVIKAKAMKGIAGISEGKKRATLFSLIQESIILNKEEEKQFREMVRTNPIYKEVKMLSSVEEVGYERGLEEAQKMLQSAEKKIREENAMKMLISGVLTHEQIAEFTGLAVSRIRELAETPASERQIH